MTKTALVTGGTRGIGAAIGRALMAQGVTVIAAYHRDHERAKAFEQETGARVQILEVTDFDACMALSNELQADGTAIDILVNNAGIVADAMAHKMAPEQWHRVVDTNLNACFNLCRAFLPGMRMRQWGRVVNISSINGLKGQVGQVNYAAAKAGMLGLTKALALENAAMNITVNALCPGYIETDMTGDMRPDILEQVIADIPAGRLGKPEEVADMAAFLASEKAAFINGAVFSINGGQFMG